MDGPLSSMQFSSTEYELQPNWLGTQSPLSAQQLRVFSSTRSVGLSKEEIDAAATVDDDYVADDDHADAGGGGGGDDDDDDESIRYPLNQSLPNSCG